MRAPLANIRRPLTCTVLLILLLRLSIAAEINIFALQGPGQASLVIDDKAHIAHLIDLGKSNDGDKLELNGKPILEALRALGVDRITITCSHPHADHHGGFRKMLATLSNFRSDGKNYFGDTIPIIESGMPQLNSLASILRKTVAGSGIRVDVRAPSGKTTYQGFSSPDSEVFIETVAYKSAEEAGVHGRSIVTKTTLANQHVHLDFDDADSNVIHQVTAQLKAEGTKIDSFIVPHHGSAAHDVDSILELNPKTAIISVDPLNRYGHPAPEILLKLMKALPPDQVIFTGAREGERVVIRPEGVTHAPYTAKSYDTFALFVLPSMVRATGKRAPGMDQAYREIWNLMSEGRDNPPEPPSAATAKATPKPTQPPSGGSAAVADQIAVNGTMHGEAFEAGTARFGFVTYDHATQQRIFTLPKAGGPTNSVQALYATLSTEDKEAVLRRLNQLSKSVDPKSKLLVSYLTDYGVPDVLRPAETRAMPVSAAPVIGGTGVKHANGGMVDLRGDKVFMGPNAQILLGAVVKKCASGLCLLTNESLAGRTISFRLPFAESVLAAAVWDRTVRRGLDQLYLSIDPTSQLLKDSAAQVPADKLHFGATLPAEWQNNRVVTHGDVNKSLIGKILWEADVAFKSESLGFNVLTGARPPANTPRDISVDEDSATSGYSARNAASVPRADRWCRMFWESGEQRIVADTTSLRIRFDGKAVVAQGEAMRLSDGKLVEYPGGDWCEDSKQVARTLESRANAPGMTGTLKQLHDLAEIQNFWRWARDHNITTSDDVKADFEMLLEQDGKEDVPVFTSGVRSTEPVLTQYQRKTGLSDSQLLHVRYGDADTMDRCILPEWRKLHEDLDALGIHRSISGTWEGGEDAIKIVDGEMRKLAVRVAACSHGITLPARFERVRTTEDDPISGVFGVEPHLQPVEIHGGILLGRSSKLLRDVLSDEKSLDDPEGRPVFRQYGKNLEFWSVSNPGEDSEIAQHLEIRDASFVEAYPSDGKINFLIRVNPDSLLRHELRQRKSPVLGRGLEWMGLYSAPGEIPYWQKAAWPCASEEPGCSWVIDASSAQLSEYLELEDENRPPAQVLEYEKADNELWIVRVNVSMVRDRLLSLTRGSENKPDVLASVARGLAWWGFDSDATDMAERSQDLDRKASQAEDYTAAFLAADQRSRDLFALSLQLAFIDRDEMLNGKTQPAEILYSLASYEKKLKRLPVAGSAGIWSEMKYIAEHIETVGAGPDIKKRIESASARYAAAAHVAELMEQ